PVAGVPALPPQDDLGARPLDVLAARCPAPGRVAARLTLTASEQALARPPEPWEMVVMTHQEATCVLSFPLKIVQTRLGDIESWHRFLVGVEGVQRTAHERYVFRMNGGQEIRVAVRAHAREHRFAWHALDGPAFDGTLRLTALDEELTRVTLSIRTRGAGVTSDLMD